MNYDKRTVIDGLKRTIEQNEEKIIEYSKPCDARNFDIEKHFVEEVAIVNLSKFHSYFEDRV
ncbi:Uncharacterised protein [Streptococcus pneumoniae]|nr:Uncharacterised protein [Streptococcus pneumoniae]